LFYNHVFVSELRKQKIHLKIIIKLKQNSDKKNVILKKKNMRIIFEMLELNEAH